MTLSGENILLIGSILLFLSVLASKTSFRLGIPTLIFFIFVGMLAGSDGPGGIYFDDPKLAQMLGIIALNFILFSGGMDTKIKDVRPVLWRGISLSTMGVAITALTVGLFANWLTELSLAEGLLLGAIVSSTDAAAVFSVLRTRRIELKESLRPTLELESGSNDPMAYFLTISLIQFIKTPDVSVWIFIGGFVLQMVLGAACGWMMGKVMNYTLRKVRLNIYGLYPVLLLALIFFTFSATDFIGGNGYLAVYLAGIVLGNKPFKHKESLTVFYDGQAWLMQVIMFLTLGLLVFPKQLVPVTGIGLLLSAILIFIARPLGVFISLTFFKLGTRNLVFLSWVGLRGAVPIIFATFPLLEKLEHARFIFNVVFYISLTSVLFQGSTLAMVARWLHVAQDQETDAPDVEAVNLKDKEEVP
jgi:cell volume regulation protein A